MSIEFSISLQFKRIVDQWPVDDVDGTVIFAAKSGIVDVTRERVVIIPIDVLEAVPPRFDPVVVDVTQPLVVRIPTI